MVKLSECLGQHVREPIRWFIGIRKTCKWRDKVYNKHVDATPVVLTYTHPMGPCVLSCAECGDLVGDPQGSRQWERSPADGHEGYK